LAIFIGGGIVGSGAFSAQHGLLVYDLVNEALLIQAFSTGDAHVLGYVVQLWQQHVVQVIDIVRHK
jgi:hypothetical protein